jgi:hypothetical protein
VEVFNFHVQMKVTSGGLAQMWYRLQAILYAWYEQIQQQALHSAVLHGDESGCDATATTCSPFWTNPMFLSTTTRP